MTNMYAGSGKAYSRFLSCANPVRVCKGTFAAFPISTSIVVRLVQLVYCGVTEVGSGHV